MVKAEQLRARRAKGLQKVLVVDGAEDISVEEPTMNSDSWLRIQSVKDIPRKVFNEVI